MFSSNCNINVTIRNILLYLNIIKGLGTSNASVEMCLRFEGTPTGEVMNPITIDAEALKHRYQTGLGTLVVYAINYEC